MQQNVGVFGPSKAKMLLLFILMPFAFLAVTAVLIFSLPEQEIIEILNLLNLGRFRWPSIEMLIEHNGVMTFERVRLFVALGLSICLMWIPFTCVAFVFFGHNALKRSREVLTREILLSSVAVCVVSLAVIFFFPNGYAPVTSRNFVAFPPNIWGMSVLIVFLYGIFFCLFPIVFWLISLFHRLIRGGSDE